MKKLAIAAAAILAASLGSTTFAADPPKDSNKAAHAPYKSATAKARSDFDKSIAACKKQAEDKQSACYKEARQTRRQAIDDASDAYTKATGKPEPSPGA
jgi:hypothetical protein